MTLDSFSRLVIEPALALLPDEMNSREAQLMLLAIGLQESGLEKRPLVRAGLTAIGSRSRPMKWSTSSCAAR